MISFLWDYWWLVGPGALAIIGLAVAAFVLKDWKLVAVGGAVLGAILTIARAFSQGSKAERARLDAANAEAKAQRQEINRATGKETDDALRKELGTWWKQ